MKMNLVWAMALTATVSLGTTEARAQTVSPTYISKGDPLIVRCGSTSANWHCTENAGFLSKCPATGPLPYDSYVTCQKYVAPSTGSYARFFYQMTRSYTETFVKNTAGQFGGYFWLQAIQNWGGSSSAVSDSCGNAPGLNIFGVPYNWCFRQNAIDHNYYYWLTFSNGVFATSGEVRDWATNMTSPPYGY